VANRTITVSEALTEDDARALAGKLVDVQCSAGGTTKTPMCIERVDAEKKTIKFRWMPAESVTANWTVANSLKIVPTGAGASSAPVYSTLIYGQDAFGRVELGGKGGFEMIYHEPGSAGANDPYNQRGTIAWKANAFCAAILNDDFIVRLESGATA
jgi:N4-gp56 family major capsid protein